MASWTDKDGMIHCTVPPSIVMRERYRWREIATEGYPPKGEYVLITDGKVTATARCDQVGPDVFWDPDGHGGYEWEWQFEVVTHWMPLPPLPGTEPKA